MVAKFGEGIHVIYEEKAFDVNDGLWDWFWSSLRLGLGLVSDISMHSLAFIPPKSLLVIQ